MSTRVIAVRTLFKAAAVATAGALSASGCALLSTGSDEADSPDPSVAPVDAAWSLQVSTLGLAVGDTSAFTCAPGGDILSFWGTGTYTSDSSICTAAVHAGVITIASGGVVTVQVTEGLEEYESSDANGVSSSSWGPYELSFQVR